MKGSYSYTSLGAGCQGGQACERRHRNVRPALNVYMQHPVRAQARCRWPHGAQGQHGIELASPAMSSKVVEQPSRLFSNCCSKCCPDRSELSQGHARAGQLPHALGICLTLHQPGAAKPTTAAGSAVRVPPAPLQICASLTLEPLLALRWSRRAGQCHPESRRAHRRSRSHWHRLLSTAAPCRQACASTAGHAGLACQACV